jgi:hypothetical protein
MLPQKAIEEFKELYFKRFKAQLSDAEATRRANNLFALYKITYMGEPSVDNFKIKPTKNYGLQPNDN